jgi:hypothetical protein
MLMMSNPKYTGYEAVPPLKHPKSADRNMWKIFTEIEETPSNCMYGPT